MTVLNTTLATLRRIQAQTGKLPGAHYIDAPEFERLRKEVAAFDGVDVSMVAGMKLLDVPIRPYDILPPIG